MLGLAVLDPSAWQPTRTWILIFVVVKTAFAAWAVAARTRYRTRSIPDLGGWGRRSPVLAISFGLIVLATIGLPGLVSWDVRARLIDLSISNGPMRWIVTLGGLASLVYYGRIALAGARPPSARVLAGATELPQRPDPAAVAATSAVATSPDMPAAASGDPNATPAPSRVPPAIDAVEARVRAGWTANRAPIASVAVLLLALTGLAMAVGGLGATSAAAAPAPEPAAPTETFVPGETEPPSPSPETSPEPSGTPGTSASPAASTSPAPSSGPSGGASSEPTAEPSPSGAQGPSAEPSAAQPTASRVTERVAIRPARARRRSRRASEVQRRSSRPSRPARPGRGRRADQSSGASAQRSMSRS